jgi:hypothetical protein
MVGVKECYFSEKLGFGMHRVAQKCIWEGEVLVISIPGKKVSKCCSGLRSSEKELPGRRSGTFRHKNTPGINLCDKTKL